MVEAQHRDGSPETLALTVRRHRDDVDLADLATLLDRWVHLGPVGGGEPVRVVALDDEDQPGRVEPRLRHPLLEVGAPQRALLRVVRERGGVEGQPRVLVTSGLEGAHGIPRRQLGSRPRRTRAEGAAHDVQAAHGHEPEGGGEGRRGGGARSGAVAPDPRVTGQGGRERSPDALSAMGRCHDELGRRGFAGGSDPRLGVADDGAGVVEGEQVRDALVRRVSGPRGGTARRAAPTRRAGWRPPPRRAPPRPRRR